MPAGNSPLDPKLERKIKSDDKAFRAQNSEATGPRTYLGLGVPQFPNLFMISGPGNSSVLTNMIVSIEQHVDWISKCIESKIENGHETSEALPEAAEEWKEHVNATADETIYPSCNSWCLGANVFGKTRVVMRLVGFPPYVEKCEEVVVKGYEGFGLSESGVSWRGR